MSLETIFVLAVFAFFMVMLAYADFAEHRKSPARLPARKS